MVDVVGFSTLTTLATEKGESGAEAIALEVGAYMGECIQIIEFFGGDVVKFLGDAVLVSFQAKISMDHLHTTGEKDTNIAYFTRQKNMLVRRAVECGLQLLARLSHYRVYLTAEERNRHRTPQGDIERHNRNDRNMIFGFGEGGKVKNGQRLSESEYVPPRHFSESYSISFDRWNFLSFLWRKHKQKSKSESDRRASASSGYSSTRNMNAIDLELHIALSCGDITNVILGDIDPHSSNNSTTGDNTIRNSTTTTSSEQGSYDNYFLEQHGRLEYAIGGPVVESLDAALAAAKAGEMSITAEAYEIIQRQPLDLQCEVRDQFYIVHTAEPPDPSKRGYNTYRQPNAVKLTSTTPNADYLLDRPNLLQQASKLSIEPLIPRIRNTSFMQIPADMSPHYFKYLNRSTLYRLQHSSDGNFPPQFRDVTIVFISLGKVDVTTDAGLQNVQKAILRVIRALVKYEGLLQQFAIDDKGATILAVFGLPPLSHEREAVFAAKAALELRDQYRQLDLPDFAIALATGVIFNCVLPQGNPFRRDPGIAGDTIILAVRMLKFPFSKNNVVCDTTTKSQIGGLCEFEDLGENFVKGKTKPVQMYKIVKFGAKSSKRISMQAMEQNTDFIGYKSEMSAATQFVDEWSQYQNHHVLIIYGASGVGKSYFCHTLQRTMISHGVQCCWSSSTEVEKSSKYYLLKNLMLSLFELIETDQIPDNEKKTNVPDTNHSSQHLSAQLTSMQSAERKPTDLSIASDSTFQHAETSNSKDRGPRLTLYTSTSSTCKPTASHSTGTHNEVAEIILRALTKCGEDEGFLPLFKVIFGTLNDVEENQYTRLLDGRGRDILLTGVLVRMVRYVSEHISFVFICDDIQWADSASIRILRHIHEQCQRVLLIMATRPSRDYNIGFLSDFCVTGVNAKVELGGLDAMEIEQIILQSFDSGVKKVSPEIVRVIQKRTGGNPLYVKNMAIILKDFNHVTLVQGELVPSTNKFDLEDLLGNFDYKRIIKIQFDRLDANFEEFLTIASCLDQYFTVYEIRAIISPSNVIFNDKNLQEIRSAVQKYDVYNFLTQTHNDSSYEGRTEVYTFTHVTIPHTIYDMVTYETRISLHRRLAEYYESQLNRDNYSQLLSKIVRHYLHADKIEKQLHYLEELADLNMKSYQLPEATNNLQMMVKILNENEEISAIFGNVHKSDIYRRLGMCYTMRTRLTEGERNLFKALDYLGEPWPRSEMAFFYSFWKNRFAQYRHLRWHVFYMWKKRTRKELGKRVVEIMAQLSNIYFHNGDGRDFVYTCLVGLNACERLGELGTHYTLFLARNALLCWLNDEKENSIAYIIKAVKYMDEKSDSSTLTIYALLCFAAGKFTCARNMLYQSIQVATTLGVVTDCQTFYRSVSTVITMRIFEGSLNSSPDDIALLKQMADIAHANGDFEAEIWLGVYHVANAIVMDQLPECAPFVSLLEVHRKKAADYNRIAIHGTLLCYYARSLNNRKAVFHYRMLVSILPSLTVTPNIFPIFGLIFCTMGMYCLVESDQIDLLASGDREEYDRFVLGITRLNHAFQQVKFWEFTQPGLYLARALPYISTGRSVEGYMVLRHGINEMHFIQEIKFLRAYYWSNIGKYAFSPQERIKWTEQARRDFDALKIPAHIYCNPDPAHCYTGGQQADLRLESVESQEQSIDEA
ncbi:uncharacterized protein BYT42DRAFT_639583 [Radiomyces spectabilis]|uniref:uncharacterized protein n=1 Tax=Radiomyces spectabilis TaxID=64574 RepID=UPI00221E442E|nr:uncharacterized protein BYT42DRAFT_639583 [Radiomyces spectabilis]KAI8374416.1 hypothetical protein BYT42DRAFT_639583 [Radiomyces spectabilis]